MLCVLLCIAVKRCRLHDIKVLHPQQQEPQSFVGPVQPVGVGKGQSDRAKPVDCGGIASGVTAEITLVPEVKQAGQAVLEDSPIYTLENTTRKVSYKLFIF